VRHHVVNVLVSAALAIAPYELDLDLFGFADEPLRPCPLAAAIAVSTARRNSADAPLAAKPPV